MNRPPAKMKTNRRIRKGRREALPAKTIKAGGKRLREIIAVALFALTALVILSLVSVRTSEDPFTSGTKTMRNWVGIFGAYLAYYLIQALGWTCWVFPILIFYLAIICFVPAREKPWKRPGRIAGLILVILSLAGIPRVLGENADFFYGRHAPPGGVVGESTSNLFMAVFGQVGTMVILSALFAAGMILSTGISLQRIGETFLMVWAWISGPAWNWLKDIAAAKGAPKLKKNLPPRPAVPRRPEIVETPRQIKIAPPVEPTRQTQFRFHSEDKFQLPTLSLLHKPPEARKVSHETLLMNSRILEKKLQDFGIEGQVTHVHPGPVITMYEYAPAPGIKVNRISNLEDDLALAMSAVSGVRVVAPIPGKGVVGIEIPNSEKETVYLLDILSADDFKKSRSKLAFALGKDIYGKPVVGDLSRMPHLLIAGATGSGKSVMLNTLIGSILFRATPSQVKFLLIDPKMVELMPYEGIPHLITPVVTHAKKASWALKNMVSIMEGRYRILSESNTKSIESYNQMVKESGKKQGEEAEEPMPYLVVVIDELADLMMLASTDVEDSVTRLAQMARAVGIHLVLATQRPSVNVITGVIKANLPTRISFQVSSKNDSRVILDANGAEQLLGSGDMLFLPPGTSKLQRIHGAYISEAEIRQIVDFIKAQASPHYDEDILKPIDEPDEEGSAEGEVDEKYQEAVELARRTGHTSISMIQRYLRVGYNRAARMVEMMEKEGIITPPDGVRHRRILPGE